jgi:glycine hydroxymethyltransferase
LYQVLSNVKPTQIKSGTKAGQYSKAKYQLDEQVKVEVRAQVQSLLARFPVYPELDLEFLLKYFG